MAYKRLGDLLIAAGVIDEAQLKQGLAAQKESGKRLGDAMIAAGIITESQLIKALEEQLGVEFVDVSSVRLYPELAQAVPKAIAKKYNVIPVRIDRDELYLAMSDPLNFMAVEDVKNISKKRVIPVIATTEAVERAILNLYGNENATKAMEEMKRDAGDGDYVSESVTGTVLDSDTEASPTIRLVNGIVERAVTEHASDIHLEPRDGEMSVRLRIDGVLRNVMNIPHEIQSSVIARIKVMGGMNTAERRVPQDGRANVRVRASDVDLRINSLPTIYGEKIVIRLLDKSAAIFSRQGIGMDEHNIPRFERIMHSTAGVILISGPTGSGKSSTMSTMVRELNTEGVNITTLEDPVEYNIDGVNQVQINEKIGMTFASGLRAILRQDPDIISVGEIRDGETAEIAMRSAITGHLVLSTIHTNDSIATLDRLLDIGVPPYLTTAALKGVISQRLVRRICPNCRKPYYPTDDELDLLEMKREPGLMFYRGEGCANCYRTGYKGRTGVFEILVMTHEMRQAVMHNADRYEMMETALKDGFITMNDRARQLVREGVTTVEEAARTINSTNE